MIRAALIAFALASFAPAIARAQSDEARHVLPIRYADRPMTLPEGTFRLDQSVLLRAGGSNGFGMGISGPNALLAGLTDWLEVGVSWPWTRDPTFLGTARLAHGQAVDLGLRVAVTTPLITTGDTDLIVSMPMVFRIAHIARIETAVTGDFLLTQTMHPIIRVPMTVVFSPNARNFLGLEGSVSLADRQWWHGEIGIFYGHTAATPLRPFGEMRIGASWNFGSNTFVTTLSFSFWTSVNPIR